LNDAGDVDSGVDAELGATNIAGKGFTDAVHGLVFVDGSGFAALPIKTRGRFTKMTFVAGVASDARCSTNHASVRIADQSGRTLWGPATVSMDRPRSGTILIARPVQIILKQQGIDGRTGYGGCMGGEVDVAWGHVTFAEG
jgi:hypothetical protein